MQPRLTRFPWEQGLPSSPERMLSLEDCLQAAGGAWFVGKVMRWEVLSFSRCLSSSLPPSPSLLPPQREGEKTSSVPPLSSLTTPPQAPPSSRSFWRDGEESCYKCGLAGFYSAVMVMTDLDLGQRGRGRGLRGPRGGAVQDSWCGCDVIRERRQRRPSSSVISIPLLPLEKAAWLSR